MLKGKTQEQPKGEERGDPGFVQWFRRAGTGTVQLLSSPQMN